MLTFSLQSGSNGNCYYVEAGGVSVLVDAGISGRQAQLRLKAYQRDIRRVKALLISHEHNDHVRCAGVFQRKFGLPLLVTRRTLEAVNCDLGRLGHVEYFQPGDVLDLGPLKIHTVPTAHDAVEGCAFVFEANGKRLGLFTDLGHPFPTLKDWLADVDGAYLESNFDPELLEVSGYPDWLKERIRGPRGHLSNWESAELVAALAGTRLRWVALAHLSQENNHPELAVETHREVYGDQVSLFVAGRYGLSRRLTL